MGDEIKAKSPYNFVEPPVEEAIVEMFQETPKKE